MKISSNFADFSEYMNFNMFNLSILLIKNFNLPTAVDDQ